MLKAKKAPKPDYIIDGSRMAWTPRTVERFAQQLTAKSSTD